MELTKNIFFNTDKLVENSKVKISYLGQLYQDASEEVSIHYGFGINWDNVNDIQMVKTDLGFQAEIDLLEGDTFNFCFKNENNNWDNNNGQNYSFEIEINDFANSWYFNVPDSNCEYEVELIRKNKVTNVPTQIMKSNNLEVPNNHILFEQNRKEIFFKNVKTNNVISKSVVNLQFINHLGNVRNANSFYKKFYDEKDLRTINNPSSN